MKTGSGKSWAVAFTLTLFTVFSKAQLGSYLHVHRRSGYNPTLTHFQRTGSKQTNIKLAEAELTGQLTRTAAQRLRHILRTDVPYVHALGFQKRLER